ncbi:hypothetical protein, partial [Burkholderia multivorans]|uniref:hypothetical protein n=1 Tax=Burkholderia multivorans TaxID=87883 RepID=UPI001C237251
LTAMLLHQSNGTLTDFRRKFVVLAHGSIFSKVGASSKPGAIQYWYTERDMATRRQARRSATP